MRVEPELRGAFIERSCGEDAALRREVESLLPHYEKLREFEPGRPHDSAWKVPSPTVVVNEMEAESSGRVPATELRPPFTVDEYTATRVLARGGMGVVYLAQDPLREAPVAIKVLRRELLSEQERLRFRLEEEILRQLRHPGIARFIRYSEVRVGDEVRPCFVLEYVAGQPLTTYAAARRLSAWQRLDLLARVCDAVEHAHHHTIIHRDLKPDNILVEESGAPKVLDFGLAQFTRAGGGLPRDRDGEFAGTPAYASPEQRAGHISGLTPRSDVYALGLIGHELLTGRLPRQFKHAARVNVRALLPEGAVPPAGDEFRACLDVVLRRALAYDEAARYASAGEFGAALRMLLGHDPTQSPWSLVKKRLLELFGGDIAWAPCPTSRPLGAVLRTRIGMRLDAERGDKPPGGERR